MAHARDALVDVAAAAVRIAEADYSAMRTDEAVKMLIAARLFAGQVALYLKRLEDRAARECAPVEARAPDPVGGGSVTVADHVGAVATRVADYGSVETRLSRRY